MAMISRRSYRDPLNVEEALTEIQNNSGTQFDPAVAESFFDVIKRPNMLEKVKKLNQDTFSSVDE